MQFLCKLKIQDKMQTMCPLQKDRQELGPATRDLRAWDPRVFEMLQQCFRT